MRILPVDVHLYPYANPGSHAMPVGTTDLAGSIHKPHSQSFAPMGVGHYAGDLFKQVHKYAETCEGYRPP